MRFESTKSEVVETFRPYIYEREKQARKLPLKFR